MNGPASRANSGQMFVLHKHRSGRQLEAVCRLLSHPLWNCGWRSPAACSGHRSVDLRTKCLTRARRGGRRWLKRGGVSETGAAVFAVGFCAAGGCPGGGDSSDARTDEHKQQKEAADYRGRAATTLTDWSRILVSDPNARLPVLGATSDWLCR
jgi:hypothetical protein